MAMDALVTGCAGFIGSHLTESLLTDGASVLGVDCFNNNYGRAQKLRNLDHVREWRGFEFVPIDLARGDLTDLVSECDVTFHLAAEPGVRPSWGRRFEAYVRNNIQATQHLLDAAANWPEKRFVYASSSSIYGQAERLPTHEKVPPQPFSPYGLTKLSGEHLCNLYWENFNVDAVSLRLFSVYGPRQRPDMAFHVFCKRMLERSQLEIFGDGAQTRDFTYVGDVVEGLRSAAITSAIGGRVFNIGGGARISLRDAIDLLAEIAGVSVEVLSVGRERGDVRDTGADIRAANAVLGYVPHVSLREGLERQWTWAVDEAARALRGSA